MTARSYLTTSQEGIESVGLKTYSQDKKVITDTFFVLLTDLISINHKHLMKLSDHMVVGFATTCAISA